MADKAPQYEVHVIDTDRTVRELTAQGYPRVTNNGDLLFYADNNRHPLNPVIQGWGAGHWYGYSLLPETPAEEPVKVHASDCAVHNMLAMPNGPCNCVEKPLNAITFNTLDKDVLAGVVDKELSDLLYQWYKEGMKARDTPGTHCPYKANTLAHLQHSAGWVFRDIQLMAARYNPSYRSFQIRAGSMTEEGINGEYGFESHTQFIEPADLPEQKR